jgi:hypothetical protein
MSPMRTNRKRVTIHPRAFDPAKDCGAKTNEEYQGGGPCRQRKGLRTDHPGTGSCWLHGGRSPNGKSHAQIEAATNALALLGIPDVAKPIEVLFEQVRIAAWRERGLRAMVQQRDALFGADHAGDGREDVVSAMHDRAIKRAAEVASMAVSAGLDERLVRIAEREAEIVLRAVGAALDAAGITGELRITAEASAAAVLEVSMPTGAELN